jgi:hypothetical protein
MSSTLSHAHLKTGIPSNHLSRTTTDTKAQGTKEVLPVTRHSPSSGFDFAKITIQRKMKVSEPLNANEQEADMVAEQVMGLSAASAMPIVTSAKEERIDRKCSACETKREEEKELANIFRKPSISAPNIEPSGDLAHEIHSMRGGGVSLDHSTKEFMESKFGHDFSNVKIHADNGAARSAQSLNAAAYTVGSDIFFNDGQYQPNSESGRGLLAHELAHTIQQQEIQRSSLENSTIVNPQYQHLELEADRVADGVMRGQSLPQAMLSRSLPRISMKKKPDYVVQSSFTRKKMEEPIVMETGHNVKPEKTGMDGKLASFTVDNLELHPSKGDVFQDWMDLAKQNGLRAYVTMGGSEGTKAQEAGLWQVRADTKQLRARWLNKRGWEEGEEGLNEAWKESGGDSEFPRAGGGTCQMDHIIELQIGGNNTMENIQVLDQLQNVASGSLLWQQVSKLAESIAAATKNDSEKPPEQIRMIFKKVQMKGGGGTCGPCCKAEKNFDKQFDRRKKGDKKRKKEGQAEQLPEFLFDYPLVARGKPTILKVPEQQARKEAPIDIFESKVPDNKYAAELISGLLLMTLLRSGKSRGKGQGKDEVHAELDTRDKTRLPITLKKGKVKLDVQNGDLKLSDDSQKNASIRFVYDYLSPGEFTKLEEVPGGLAGEGYIIPTKVPFIKRLEVAFSPDYFRLAVPLNKDKLKSPFAAAKITEASIAIDLAPKLKPEGMVAFEFGGRTKLASSIVKVSADESGIVLDGELSVFLPGVDRARGTIRYNAGTWSGGAHIEANQIKLPFVESGSLDVFLTASKIDATGKLKLKLPGKNEASLELEYSRNKWVFRGTGLFEVNNRYLKPFHASLYYDGEVFRATGKVGFAFAGLEGNLEDATYEIRDSHEKIYGKGNIKINKGRAKGDIDVELHPNQKITGKGHLTYVITKDLIARAGITVDEQQKIVFDGELSFPNYELFRRFPSTDQKNPIFSASGRIPIPGLNFAGVGIYVKLRGGLNYYYYAGPAILKDIRAAVRFSPFDADPDFNFNLKAAASIPAGGGIEGDLGAAVALDVYVAEVGGELGVKARAGLEGKVELGAEIAYRKDRFSIDAHAYIGGKLILEAGLNAMLYAEAGVWKFKARTEKTWKLSTYTINTGLQLGIRLPLRYDSVEGFRIPSLSDIKPEPATLDIQPSNILSSLFSSAQSSERET